MIPNTLEISHSRAVQSYAFWSAWWEPKETDGENFKRVKALPFRKAGVSDLLDLNQGVCPFCQGAEVVRFSQNLKVGAYAFDYVLCVCRILRMKGRDWEDLESPWQPRKVSEIELIGDKDTRGYTKFIKDTTVDFIKNLGTWIYLYGGFGSGKSHLLYAVKNSLRGLALYVNAADLASILRASVGRNETSDIVDTIAACPVLLLDDLGVEKGSDFLYSALYMIVNRRYSQGALAPVFVTSNISQDALKSHSDENIRRIASRLNDRNLVTGLITTQEDYRSRQ